MDKAVNDESGSTGPLQAQRAHVPYNSSVNYGHPNNNKAWEEVGHIDYSFLFPRT